MSVYYRPSADAYIGANYINPKGAAFPFYEQIDDPYYSLNFNQPKTLIRHPSGGGVGFDAQKILFRFPHTLLYGQGDPAAPSPQLFRIGSAGITLNIVVRPFFTGVDTDWAFLARRIGADISTSVQIGTPFTVLSGVFVPAATQTNPWLKYSSAIATDPIAGGAWSVANLANTEFGFWPTGSPGNIIEISNLSLLVDEQANPPEGRARLREAVGEPAMFCALCALPFPRSALTLVSDPDHPHLGRLVCAADYDDYYPPDEDPAVIEGDIDHEQR